MTEDKSNKYIFKLKQYAETIREVAKNEDDFINEHLIEGAAVIERHARNAAQKNENNLLELDENASAKELQEARLRSAVKRGEEFYLPTSRPTAVGLPNALLRSAFFSASEGIKNLSREVIDCQGDVSIFMTGIQLIGYDRRVLAVCLNYYQENRPLASINNNEWIELTFYQLAMDLKKTYGINVHKAIIKSLIRLNAARIVIRIDRKNIPISELIQVKFHENYLIENYPESFLLGSDSFSFRVMESMANLYGKAKWTPVSNLTLHDSSGLPAWLASYYSTHAGPYPLKIKDLFRYSGSTCIFSEFLRKLNNALTKLQKSETPEEYRVSKFEINDTHLTVHLDRWQK